MKAMVGRAKRSGCGWQEAESLQGPDPAWGVAFHRQGFIVGSRIPVVLAAREHEEDGPQYLVSQADDGAFVVPPCIFCRGAILLEVSGGNERQKA